MPAARRNADDPQPAEGDEPFDVFVPGSRYRVYSRSDADEPLLTDGTFLGLTGFGTSDQGARIELSGEHGDGKGLVRVIPLSNILYIDIMEQKRRPPSEKKAEEHHAVFYT